MHLPWAGRGGWWWPCPALIQLGAVPLTRGEGPGPGLQEAGHSGARAGRGQQVGIQRPGTAGRKVRALGWGAPGGASRLGGGDSESV